MNGIELFFFIFLVALAGIIVGIFIGFGMGQQHILAAIDKEKVDVLREYKANVAVRREDVLDAEVLD